MKRKRARQYGIAVLAAACLIAVVAACSNPMGAMLREAEKDSESAADGTLKVSFKLNGGLPEPSAALPAGIRATVYPNGDPSFFQPDYYDIHAIGPNNAIVDANNVYPWEASWGVSGFIPGYWYFKIDAYANDGPTLLARGTTTATLVSNSANVVEMRLKSRPASADTGSLSIDIYTQTTIDYPSLTITLTPLDPAGSALTYGDSVADAGVYYTYTHTYDLPEGMYRMNCVLRAGSIPKVVWGESEIVYIVRSILSSYHQTVTATMLGRPPAYDPGLSLSSGVVVESGGEATRLSMYVSEPEVVVVYTTRPAVVLSYDALTSTPGSGCFLYQDPIALNQALDADDGSTDGSITVRLRSFNAYGAGPAEVVRDFYLDDAIYVDDGAIGPYDGTSDSPYMDLQTAFSRVTELNRTSMTDVRVGYGSYAGNFTMFGGTRLSGSLDPANDWERYSGLPDDESLYSMANATFIMATSAYGVSADSPSAALRVYEYSGKAVVCEYVGISSGNIDAAGYYHTALLSSYSSNLTLSHMFLQGQSTGSFVLLSGATIFGSAHTAISDCSIVGRANSIFTGSGDVAGLNVENSIVDISLSTISAGIANDGGDGYGLRVVGSSTVNVNGTSADAVVIKGPISQTSGRNYGVGVRGSDGVDTSVNLDYCAISSSVGNTVYGVAFEKARGRIRNGSVLLNNGTCQEATVVSCTAPSAAYAQSAAPDFTIQNSSIQNLSATAASGKSIGIRLLAGKALISNNSGIAAGPASMLEATPGASYGIMVAPGPGAWAEATISGNSEIIGKDAFHSSGIRAVSNIHVAIDGNERVFSASANSLFVARRESITMEGISNISGRDAGLPMLEIRDMPQIFSGLSSSANSQSRGLFIDVTDPAAPIIVERCKISGGMTGESGADVDGIRCVVNGTNQAADIVFRNNVVFKGQTGIRGNGVFLDRPDGVNAGSGRLVLANNTVISNTLPASINWFMNALRLEGYSRPELYNNIIVDNFLPGSTASSCAIYQTAYAAPARMMNNTLLSRSGQWYCVDGTPVPDVNLSPYSGNSTYLVESIAAFANSYPETISAFADNFSGALSGGVGAAFAELRTGGLDLSSAASAMGAWHFADDYGEDARTSGWSRGAVEHP